MGGEKNVRLVRQKVLDRPCGVGAPVLGGDKAIVTAAHDGKWGLMVGLIGHFQMETFTLTGSHEGMRDGGAA